MSIYTPMPQKNKVPKYRLRLLARMQKKRQESLKPQPLWHQRFNPVHLGNGMIFDSLMGIVTGQIVMPSKNNEPPH